MIQRSPQPPRASETESNESESTSRNRSLIFSAFSLRSLTPSTAHCLSPSSSFLTSDRGVAPIPLYSNSTRSGIEYAL